MSKKKQTLDEDIIEVPEVSTEADLEKMEKGEELLRQDYDDWLNDSSWKDKVEGQTLLGDNFVVEIYVYWPKTSNIIGLDGKGFEDPVLSTNARVLLKGNTVVDSHKDLKPGDIVKIPDWLALGQIRNYEYDLANSLDQQRGADIRMNNRPATPMLPAIAKLKQNIYVADILKSEIDKYDAYTFRLGSEYIISKIS